MNNQQRLTSHYLLTFEQYTEDPTTITYMKILHYVVHNYTYNTLFIWPICIRLT